MMKLISAILLITFSTQTFSQTCADKLLRTKKVSYIDKLGDGERQVVGFLSTAGGLAVGMTVATGTLPIFLVAVGVASTPILAGEAIKGIQNRPINRMIKLIHQSEKFLANPETKPGRLLRRLQQKLSGEKIEISTLELASAIATANKDPKQCGSIHRIKDIQHEIESGQLPIIELDEEESTNHL